MIRSNFSFPVKFIIVNKSALCRRYIISRPIFVHPNFVVVFPKNQFCNSSKRKNCLLHFFMAKGAVLSSSMFHSNLSCFNSIRREERERERDAQHEKFWMDGHKTLAAIKHFFPLISVEKLGMRCLSVFSLMHAQTH